MASMLDKKKIVELIIDQLNASLSTVTHAAKRAHEVATSEANIADNKYDTLSLESSYLAQGQANRAQELRLAIDTYQNLPLRHFEEDSVITVTALVTLEAEDGSQMTVFMGPQAGGLKVGESGHEVTVITPSSPLGKGLLGKMLGDTVERRVDDVRTELEIVAVD